MRLSVSSMGTETVGIEVIRPEWPAPAAVCALTTTRRGGVSIGHWSTLNLGDHVGDASESVAANRRRLVEQLGLPAEPLWLRQVHGTTVARGDGAGRCADARLSERPGRVCAVLTADCLPVLFCNRSGTRVAAAHAGWRGLLAGVLESTVAAFEDVPAEVFAWLGPAIGPQAFEVGDEVRGAFVGSDPAAAAHFRDRRAGRWMADLYGLARQRLSGAGVTEVYGGGLCTFSDDGRFFSYRRDGVTGRMASLIWRQSG